MLSRAILKTSVAANRTLALRLFSSSTGRMYTKDHEWVQQDGKVGISDYAQAALGDVVFVDLPAVGKKYAKKTTFATVESVKAASDVYAPVSGEVVEINSALADTPDLVNKAPYTDGWMVKLTFTDFEKESKDLMNEEAYQKYLKEVAH
eukprot:TRINITY_DN466_c0_g1_i1.p1 TRINITY_DN466_c0_g1~~TRINITY_DN466_c0_g1_i1.p1  ORF type:complete len:158 (+),score=62.20 TRINITY_DN466_c0_g1_i1:30-476(+)